MAKTKNSVLRLLEDTPEAAYWVGLFFADGSIGDRRMSFFLGEKDREHVHRFRDWLDPGLALTAGGAFSLQDTEQIRTIKERFDLRHRKTYNPPEHLPYTDDILLRAWLVGFIDGDGCIVYQHGRKDVTISVVSHRSWEPFIVRVSQQLSFGYVHTANYTRLVSHRMADNISLKRFALEHNLPMMKRKWDRVDLDYRMRSGLAPRVEKMIPSGGTDQEIATAIGCSASLVYKVRRSMV